VSADEPFGPHLTVQQAIQQCAGKPLALWRFESSLTGPRQPPSPPSPSLPAPLQAKKKVPSTWGPKAVLLERLPRVPHTACDCGAAVVLHNEPLKWLFCQKCQMAVTQEVRARCKCGQLQTSEQRDPVSGELLPVGWVECDMCGLMSHIECYKNIDLSGAFLCRECKSCDHSLRYECTKCNAIEASEALVLRHIAAHGDSEPIAYKLVYVRGQDTRGDEGVADEDFDPDAVDEDFSDV
jgi:hypothetical protein